MVAKSFSGLLNPNDLTPGPRLIDGSTIAALVQQNNTGNTGLTALAGGGYTGATPCSNYINEFTTVASANDSAVLPSAIAGIEITVINSGAQNLRLYCSTGNQANLNASGVAQADTIIPQGGGTATYITIPANGTAVMSATALGRWKSQNY